MNKKIINLPNIISLFALIFSIFGIIILFKDFFYTSLILIFTAFILDILDGYIARKLNITSDYGRKLDAFIDVFIYLIYPGLVFYYYFNINDLLSLIIIIFFITAGLYRLIRFIRIGLVNVTENHQGDYPGMPVVYSHVIILILLILKYFNITELNIIANVLLVIMSSLMISKIPFYKPKKIYLLITVLILIILALFFISIYGNN